MRSIPCHKLVKNSASSPPGWSRSVPTFPSFFSFFTIFLRGGSGPRSLDNERDDKFPFTQGVAFNNFVLGYIVAVLPPPRILAQQLFFYFYDCVPTRLLLAPRIEERNQETSTTRGVASLYSADLFGQQEIYWTIFRTINSHSFL